MGGCKNGSGCDGVAGVEKGYAWCSQKILSIRREVSYLSREANHQ